MILIYDLDKFTQGKIKTQKTKERKTNIYDTGLEVYNEMLGTYFDEFYDLSDAKRSKMDPKEYPTNLILDAYDHSEWYKGDLSSMPPQKMMKKNHNEEKD